MLGIWLGEKGFTSWSARGGWLMITVALLGIIMFSQIRWMILLLCVCAVVGGLRSHSEWSAVHSAEMGPFTGRAVLVTDPEPVGAGVRIVSEIAGQRFESWLYGSKAKRAMQHVAGESLAVIGHLAAQRSTRRVATSWLEWRREWTRLVIGIWAGSLLGLGLAATVLSVSL